MAQYKQMAGGAGRKGQSDFGESFLLISNRQHTTWAQNLVCEESSLPARIASVSSDEESESLDQPMSFYLESIACGILKTKEDAGELACRTFAWSSGRDKRFYSRSVQDSALKKSEKVG